MNPSSTSEFYAFGEILWDCMPSGRHAGGAPFNVTCHLAQLGVSSALISSIGQDGLGDEILEVAAHKHVNAEFVTRARFGLSTGTVLVSIDERGNATYELVQPAAWDEIMVPEACVQAVTRAGGFIYGSLAGRSPYNLHQLKRLLQVVGPLKFFDVNLRPPFADPALIIELAQSADVIKLNHEEVAQLAAWVRYGELRQGEPTDVDAIQNACAELAAATSTRRVCVTMGANGAALWDDGEFVTVPAPQVEVRDTVGAGDAFMAGLMVGLTRGKDSEVVLENACHLGAFVASQFGATPVIPRELLADLTAHLRGE